MGAQCAESKLGVTMVTMNHVTAAVSCCLEMALWSTLWMADQVSLTASGGLSLMNFLACGPGRPVVSRMKGTRLMCGYLSNLFFSALLAPAPVFASKTEYAVHLAPHSSALSSPLHIFASENGFIASVCILHSFFGCVLHFPIATEHTTKYLEFSRTGQLVLTSRRVDHWVLQLLLRICACPPLVRRFWLRIPPTDLVHQFFHHLFQVLFRL